MTRQIYIVYAHIVDANGTFNPLNGYPKTFDSKSYNNDAVKALKRAQGEFYDTIGALCKNDTRQIQTAMLMSADGSLIVPPFSVGKLADVPESEEQTQE